MRCHKCNAEIGAEDAFCGECGATVPKPKVTEKIKTEDMCPSCGAEMKANEAFCGECGHQIKLEQLDKPKQFGYEYPLVPMALTAGLIFVLLFIQSQLESDGLYDDWVTTENFRLFVVFVGCVIAILTGISIGLYIFIKSVKTSQRKFHSFSVFFLISIASFLGTELFLVSFGTWEYRDIFFSITSATLFAIVTSLTIVGISSLSFRNIYTPHCKTRKF